MIIESIGGNQLEFNYNEYSSKVRPILYEYFHLIDQKIAGIVLAIDGRLSGCNYYEEITDEDHDFLCSNYNILIYTIKELLHKYRESTSSDDR